MTGILLTMGNIGGSSWGLVVTLVFVGFAALLILEEPHAGDIIASVGAGRMVLAWICRRDLSLRGWTLDRAGGQPSAEDGRNAA